MLNLFLQVNHFPCIKKMQMPSWVGWQKGRAKWFGFLLLLPTHKRVMQCDIPNRKKTCFMVPLHVCDLLHTSDLPVCQSTRLTNPKTHICCCEPFIRTANFNRSAWLVSFAQQLYRANGTWPIVMYVQYNTRPNGMSGTERPVWSARD